MGIDPPAVESEITLTLPDREMLPGRVDVCGDDGVLEIALLSAPRTPIPQLEASRLFLEYVVSVGVYRLVGRLKLLDQAPRFTDQYGVFDVARFTSASPPMLLHRRDFIRSPYVATVNIVPDRPDGVAVACETINVSGGGLLVRGLDGVRIGDELIFQLAPLDGDALPINGRCQVVRCEASGIGVRFTRIDEADRDRLVTFAYQRELAERGRRLSAGVPRTAPRAAAPARAR
jgi:PilZ domain